MKKIITIFILPNEIDLYRDLIRRIQKDITNYELKDFWIDSTLCVSDQMVNWEESKVSKEKVINWFSEINKNIDGDFSIDIDGTIKGCVDKRRESSPSKYTDAISFTWIDADILFPDGTFYIIDECVNNLKDRNFVLTPQYPKMWDSSWDVVVHEKYMDTPYNYMELDNYSPEDLFGIFGDVELGQLTKGTFKFGGGAITTFSSSILKFFPIPDTFGSYGEEDTYIMVLCGFLYLQLNLNQFIIENLVYSQKNRDSIDRRQDVFIYNRKKEFRQCSLDKFKFEVVKKLKNVKYGQH